MADLPEITAQQIEAAVKSIERLGGNIGKYTDAVDRRQKDDADKGEKLKSQINKKVAGTAEAVGALTGSFKEASRYLTTIVGGTIFGSALRAVAGKAEELTNTYRDLSANGNLFSGSILGMMKAAGAAGLPLDDFADAVKQAGLSAKQLQSKDFPGLQREMRTQMLQFGNFGMSVQQITAFTGIQLETYRKSGAVQHMTNTQVSGSMTELAKVTLNMAKVSDKASEKIAEMANNALQSSAALSRVQALPQSQRAVATKQMQLVTTILAAQAGKAGEFMSSAFADTVGVGGAQFTSAGKTLIGSGMGQLVTTLNELASNQTVDGTVDALSQFKKVLGENISTLQTQLANPDMAAGAQELLQLYQELPEKINAAEIKRTQEFDGMTKFMLTVSTMWDQIMGGFRKGFLEGFTPLFASVGDFAKSEKFPQLIKGMTEFGAGLGKFVAGILNPENLKRIGSFFEGIIIGMQPLVKLVGVITGIFGHISRVSGMLAGALVSLLIVRKLKNMFSTGSMIVKAGAVYVNGALGGAPGVAAEGVAAEGVAVAEEGAEAGGLLGAFKLAKAAKGGGIKGVLGGLGAGGKMLGSRFGGLLKGGGKLLRGAGGALSKFGGAPLMAALESLDYFSGEKSLSIGNLLRSALSIGGGVAGGAIAGGGSFGLGTIAGGTAGYYGGKALGNWLLGPDTPSKGLGQAGSDMTDAITSQGADTPADKANESLADMLKALNDVETGIRSQIDVMVAAGQTQATKMEEQIGLLTQIRNNKR